MDIQHIKSQNRAKIRWKKNLIMVDEEKQWCKIEERIRGRKYKCKKNQNI